MKKFLPYILILIVLVGLFSPRVNVDAQVGPVIPGQIQPPSTPGAPVIIPPTTPESISEFQKQVEEDCGFNPISKGCVMQLFYWIFHDIPAWFLLQTAYFFNVLISISLNGTLFKHPFVATAWGVVRDLSNLFFILILLYIAIKIILGIGGSEVKKMIAQVIVIALLINFSMFMTKVVIDTSNILALIFYNKLSVDTYVKADGTIQIRPYNPVAGEKDVAGGMVSGFDPTTKIGQPFFAEAKKTWNPDGTPGPTSPQVPFGIMLSITLLSGLIMCFAIYALFISGLSFVGRLIELWILIIFSPFAFMSSTVSKLNDIEYLGWKSWFHRLLTVSFMAPIFMFFLYFIFLLIGSKPSIFASIVQPIQGGGMAGMATMLLGVILPAMLILILLLKATEFAKKGSGKFGEVLSKAAGTVGGLATGLAIGAATGGAAMALRGTIGRGAANIAESNKFRDWAAKSKGGQFISNRISGVALRSFDARNAPGADAFAKMGGVNLGASKSFGLAPKKGFAENRIAAVKKQEEFATKQLDTSDKGKAELTRGRMNTRQAAAVEAQLIRGGMDRAIAAGHRASLEGVGIDTADVSGVARYLDAAKREIYADRLDRRSTPTVFGNFYGHAQRRNTKSRVSANKIRRSAPDAAAQANLARVTAALAAAQAAGNPPAGGTPHP